MKGTIVKVLPLQEGVSQAGKQWQKQGFVIETEEEHEHIVMYTLFGEQKIKDNYADVGDHVEVEFDLESREYNGKWYTDVNAWKVTVLAKGSSEPEPIAPAVPEKGDSLPF